MELDPLWGQRHFNFVLLQLLSHKICVIYGQIKRFGPGVIKLFMLNSAEHEILTAHKIKIARNNGIFRL